MRLAIDRLNDPIVRVTFKTNDTNALTDTPPVVDTVPCLSFANEKLGCRKKEMIV